MKVSRVFRSLFLGTSSSSGEEARDVRLTPFDEASHEVAGIADELMDIEPGTDVPDCDDIRNDLLAVLAQAEKCPANNGLPATKRRLP